MSVKVLRVPPIRSESRGRVRHFARRAGRAVASAASDEKHTLAASLAAAAFGYAERPGKDGKSLASKLPKIPGMSTVGSAAAIAWGVSKFGPFKGNRMARHIATGLLAVAAYKLGKGGTDALSGDDDEGEDYAGSYGD